MGMLLFLDQQSRFSEALRRNDPLKCDPFINILDPINLETNCSIPFVKIFSIFGGLGISVILFSIFCHPICSKNIFYSGSILKDYGSLGVLLSGLILPVIVIWGRRITGDLINTIELKKITQSLENPFCAEDYLELPKFIKFFMRLSSCKMSLILMPIIWIGNFNLGEV